LKMADALLVWGKPKVCRGSTSMRDTFGSLDDARLALARQVVANQPGSADLLFALASALAARGAYDEYADVFQQAYLLKPSAQPAIKMPMTQAEATALRDAAQALIARGIRYAPVLAASALASAVLGDTQAAAALVDYDRFFRLIPDVVPDNTDTDFFNALASEIKTGLTFHDGAGTRAIRQAWRNDRVMESPLPACRAFAGEIRRQVARYIDALPASDHAFIAARPRDFDITAWAVLSHGEGHHIPHIHPKAWLSGVYYVVRPDIACAPGQRGWLRVGPPHGLDHQTSGWQERLIAPGPGNLVLMPAYFFHETRPMGVDQERICIAFDVMPRELSMIAGAGD
jgi:tetratricopeptide (TPR) repeat protein